MKTTKSNRKALNIRPSFRSTDYISPAFILGCAYTCSYCYEKRNRPEGVNIALNVGQILSEINSHAYFTEVQKPNQTHPVYTSYDLSCNSDLCLHAKQIDWRSIFTFFRDHPIAFGSLATKYVNKELLTVNPNKKVRIRFSLIPESYRTILEPRTSTILERLEAVSSFLNAGYEVHLNFSPVIVYEGWLDKYKELFELVNTIALRDNWANSEVKCEVIFLTHNKKKHQYNLQHNLPGEYLLWNHSIQESKVSQNGSINIRYKHNLKADYIKQWLELKDNIIPWCEVRYIF